jgi:hemerythrin-like domain-containing protein
MVTDHIAEEESAMFPEAERKLGTELDEIGRALEDEKASSAVKLL